MTSNRKEEDDVTTEASEEHPLYSKFEHDHGVTPLFGAGQRVWVAVEYAPKKEIEQGRLPL